MAFVAAKRSRSSKPSRKSPVLAWVRTIHCPIDGRQALAFSQAEALQD